MTSPKVIKVSELIRLRSYYRKSFKKMFGCELNSDRCIKLGEDESIGGEIYDYTIKYGEAISALDHAISLCKRLDNKKGP